MVTIWCRLVAVSAVALSFTTIDSEAASGKSQQLQVGGSLRLRGELKEGFDFSGSGTQDYVLTQLRTNLRWDPRHWIGVFVEGQDARVLGESRTETPAIDQDAVPNVFVDQFDLHQGYVDLHFRLSGQPLTGPSRPPEVQPGCEATDRLAGVGEHGQGLGWSESYSRPTKTQDPRFDCLPVGAGRSEAFQ